MIDTDARLWPARDAAHALSVEAWAQVRVEFKKALALKSQIRRAGRLS
jgi:hypothetical protein